jgi:hypothetical protein
MKELLFKTSTEKLYFVDWRDVELLAERDPDGRTMPSPDPDQLLLTANDCVFLWSLRISF